MTMHQTFSLSNFWHRMLRAIHPFLSFLFVALWCSSLSLFPFFLCLLSLTVSLAGLYFLAQFLGGLIGIAFLMVITPTTWSKSCYAANFVHADLVRAGEQQWEHEREGELGRCVKDKNTVATNWGIINSPVHWYVFTWCDGSVVVILFYSQSVGSAFVVRWLAAFFVLLMLLVLFDFPDHCQLFMCLLFLSPCFIFPPSSC